MSSAISLCVQAVIHHFHCQLDQQSPAPPENDVEFLVNFSSVTWLVEHGIAAAVRPPSICPNLLPSLCITWGVLATLLVPWPHPPWDSWRPQGQWSLPQVGTSPRQCVWKVFKCPPAGRKEIQWFGSVKTHSTWPARGGVRLDLAPSTQWSYTRTATSQGPVCPS